MSKRGFAIVLATLALSAAFAIRVDAAPVGRYIVVLHDTASVDQVVADHGALGAQVGHIYRHALRGYSASLPEALRTRLLSDPRVALVERDSVMSVYATQSPATWGIDRADQRDLPLSNSYSYANTGAGVTAYIIDTGIRMTHSEFGGRAVSGIDTIDGRSADDCHGHGTHVAGTVGGATYGIAKEVALVAVRVLNCVGSGATSGVIAGVDWVTENHDPGAPAVANMSLGGGASSALDTAVRNSIDAGVSYAIAAGNGNIIGLAQDSCSVSPARVTEAMTIGASDRNDAKASWSNYGTCVDWHAPGVSITSAWNSSDTAADTISGTSMAAPHTAGVAALYLETAPSASPAAVQGALLELATKNMVTGTGGGLLTGSTPNNHLLFSNL